MKRTSSQTRIRSRHRAGAAMIETVLALPFVFLILALVFLVGRSMMRLQHVSVADRYEAWRSAVDAPGPSRGGIEHPQLAQTFMPGEVEALDVDVDNRFPSEPGNLLYDAVVGHDDAEEVVERALERLPDGRHVRVKATFTSTIPLEQRIALAGPMRSNHVRLAGDWKFATGIRYNAEHERWEPTTPCVTIHRTIRDIFLQSLDAPLAQLARDDNGVAESIRRLYLSNPGYGGPYLDLPENAPIVW